LPFETVDFDGLIDQMAKRVFGTEESESLPLGEREKLAVFIRDMVKGALAFVEAKTQERFQFEQAVYGLVGSSRQSGIMIELRIFERPKDSEEPRRVCAIAMKEGDYMGPPDGSPKITDSRNLPKLVSRKRIDVVDVKPAKSNFWASANRVVAEGKGKGKGRYSFVSHYDIQKPK
jgi:hypothetical protein